MKKVLVTGGAGFIGSHLCERLLNEGNEVVSLDNYFTGSKSNIVQFMSNPYFEVIRHDITMPFYIEVDEIYNLACPASPVHYQYNAIKTIKTAVIGTLNVLGIAKRVNARILQASTSEIYGDPKVHPQPEDYYGSVNPIGIRSCYDEGKRIGESLMMNYYRQNNVDIRIVRIFNTFGPRMAVNDGRVISNFIIQALRNEDITIYGEGLQTRSFCYVSDLIEGLHLMMEQNDFIGPVNIGNPEEITILQLAQTIKEITGSTSKLIFKKLPQDDPLRRNPDITLAEKKLKWKPKISWEDGLRKTINYFQKII